MKNKKPKIISTTIKCQHCQNEFLVITLEGTNNNIVWHVCDICKTMNEIKI